MPRGPDFFRHLTEQSLEQMEEYARQPGRTGDELLAWLEKIGVKASRSAVYRWLQDFRLEDRTRRSSEVARQYLAAARESDPHAVTEASLVRFEQMIFDALVGGEELTPDELAKIAQAMRSGMGSRKDLVAMRQKQSEAVKEAEQAVEAGKSAPDVVATIKKALGISAAA